MTPSAPLPDLPPEARDLLKRLPIYDLPVGFLLACDGLEFHPEDAVVEIGVGMGYAAAALAPSVSEFVGIDVARGTVELLARLFSSEPSISFYHYDACDERLGDDLAGRFTIAFSFDTLEHVSDPGRFFSNLNRILRPGGRSLVGFPNEPFGHRHGITSFSSLQELEAALRPSSWSKVRVQTMHFGAWAKLVRALLYRLPKNGWRSLVRKPKIDKPQTLDETLAFRRMSNPRPFYPLVKTYIDCLARLMGWGQLATYRSGEGLEEAYVIIDLVK